MDESFIEALDRTEKLSKIRLDGFVPGVIHGEGFVYGKPVKFNMAALQKVISKHGSKAKVWVKVDDSKKIGVIKEIQREPVSGKIYHVDMQLVSMDHDLKTKIPIIFHGKNKLEAKRLVLHVYKSEIEISGNPQSMPESIVVDVEGKGLDYSITLKDMHFDNTIKVHEHDSEVFAVISEIRSKIESPKEETPVEIKKEVGE